MPLGKRRNGLDGDPEKRGIGRDDMGMISNGGFFGFFLFMYDILHCYICRPSDSTVPEDAGIEPRTVVTTALDVRRSNH
jgi:hypothetical protein